MDVRVWMDELIIGLEFHPSILTLSDACQ